MILGFKYGMEANTVELHQNFGGNTMPFLEKFIIQ